MLTPEQEDRYLELQDMIKEGGRGGFMKLTQAEKDEYTHLNNLVKDDKKGMIPVQFVLDILQEIYVLVKDGKYRAEILRHKRSVQTYNQD